MTPALHDELDRLESRIGPLRIKTVRDLIGISEEIQRQNGRREILDAVNGLFGNALGRREIGDRRTAGRDGSGERRSAPQTVERGVKESGA